MFAIATTFILVGSTKILIVIATYSDFLVGLVRLTRFVETSMRTHDSYIDRERAPIWRAACQGPDRRMLPRKLLTQDHL